RAARHGDVTARPCLASRQHEGGSQLVWRRAGAGGESEVEARRGTRSSPRMPTGSTPRRSSPHSSHWRDGWGRRWVRAHAAKPSARWQMFCVCATMASSQAMGACTRDSVARPRCLPGRVVRTALTEAERDAERAGVENGGGEPSSSEPSLLWG
ncbi:hypothetical protein B0H14DRAFT_2916934, partial [Mycena olivaceomarginata]